MTDTNVKKALADHVPKKMSAKIREYLPLIQQKIDAGVTFVEILEILKMNGLEVKRNTLVSYLQRFRKEQEMLPGQSPKQDLPALAPLRMEGKAIPVLEVPTVSSAPEMSEVSEPGGRVSAEELKKVMFPENPAEQSAKYAAQFKAQQRANKGKK